MVSFKPPRHFLKYLSFLVCMCMYVWQIKKKMKNKSISVNVALLGKAAVVTTLFCVNSWNLRVSIIKQTHSSVTAYVH